jgi:hypothetical protein
MTEPATNTNDAARRFDAASETVRREAFRLARDSGASLVTRPIYSSQKEPTARDVEALAGARAARDLELAARSAARDYIRQAREAGHHWDQIAQAVGLTPGGDADQQGATPAEAAYTYAAGRPDAEALWEPRYFYWTCRSCDQHISDGGLIQGPSDDEIGHAEGCRRLAQAIADWDANWEAEP